MTTPLTYLSMFQLPTTGHENWCIADNRSKIPGGDFGSTVTATAKLGEYGYAEYTPGKGWEVDAHHTNIRSLRAEMNALEVHLPPYTAVEYAANVEEEVRLIARDASRRITRLLGIAKPLPGLDPTALVAQAIDELTTHLHAAVADGSTRKDQA